MPTPDSPDLDVAIIGAGAAGIAAARKLRDAGVRARLFEASGRIGGRALTQRIEPDVPVDLGCAWLHSADRNPLRAMADRHGIRYAGNPILRFHRDGHWLNDRETAALQARLGTINQAIAAAGRQGRDMPAAALLDPADRYAPVRDYLLTAINAVSAAAYSTADAAMVEDSGENWVAYDGLGTLIERLADGLEIVPDTPVRCVTREPHGVRLLTDRGTVGAAVAIATVSTGVLRAGALRFEPPLPDRHRAALEQVPMGIAEKLALRFERDVLGLAANTFGIVERHGEALGFHVLPGVEGLIVAHAGGPQAEALLDRSEDEAVRWVLDFLEPIRREPLDRYLVAAIRTAWRDDPWTHGSYSAARPGGHHARRELARPVHECILFAGEATEPTRYTTVHGAWGSGERAAAEALRLLPASGTGRG